MILLGLRPGARRHSHMRGAGLTFGLSCLLALAAHMAMSIFMSTATATLTLVDAAEQASGIGGAAIIEAKTTNVATTTPCPAAVLNCPVCEACPVCPPPPPERQCPEVNPVKSVYKNGYSPKVVYKTAAAGAVFGSLLTLLVLAVVNRALGGRGSKKKYDELG